MSMSPYLKDTLIDRALAQTYISLHAADPGAVGSNEITGAGYSRQPVVFSHSVDGVASNMEELIFVRLPAGRFNYAGLWDAPMGGNFLWGAWLGETQEVRAGDSFVIDAGILITKMQ